MRDHPNEWDKLLNLFDTTADQGPPHNEQKFRAIIGYDGLFEFKTKRIRIFCFFDEGGLILCSTGYLKDSHKAPKRELERAASWRSKYLEAKKAKTLQHLNSATDIL